MEFETRNISTQVVNLELTSLKNITFQSRFSKSLSCLCYNTGRRSNLKRSSFKPNRILIIFCQNFVSLYSSSWCLSLNTNEKNVDDMMTILYYFFQSTFTYKLKWRKINVEKRYFKTRSFSKPLSEVRKKQHSGCDLHYIGLIIRIVIII